MVAIFLFLLAFIPPIEWQSIINYFMVTPFWIWIGQTGYLVMAAVFCTAGYFFVREVVT